MNDSRPAPRRRSRPPRIPFLSLHPAERVRGLAILEENPDHGLLLWESYRNVGDWAVTPRASRCSLFGPAAAECRTGQIACAKRLDDGARSALEAIRDMVARPGGVRERTVALACRRLSAWAGEQGRPETQFYFAAAAGACLPADARQAYDAGRLARDMARWDTAEVWLEHAVAAAKRGRDRETQTLAVLGLGNLFYRQGFYRKARDTHLGALSLAGKYRLREYRGRALHDLFVIAVELNDVALAEAHAADALNAYGPSHPRLPALAHDIAYFWLERSCFSRASTVFRAVLPHFRKSSALHLRVLANIARATAGYGDVDEFDSLWAQAWSLTSDLESRATLAAALVDLAEGALSLADRERALCAANHALGVARARGEVDVCVRAEVVIAAAGSLIRPRKRLTAHIDHPTVSAADQLAADLVYSLERYRMDEPPQERSAVFSAPGAHHSTAEARAPDLGR